MGRAMVWSVLLFALVAGAVQAQAPYPAKPNRLVVPSSPGGGTDITARIMTPKLSDILGQQVIVEDKAGAGNIIGFEAVARAIPDGYTLLMGLSPLTILPAMRRICPTTPSRTSPRSPWR